MTYSRQYRDVRTVTSGGWMQPPTSSIAEPSVLLVGPADEVARAAWPKLTDPLAELAHVEHVADLQAAGALMAEGRSEFDLVVLCESRPGQFSTALIDNLRRLAPLMRFWRLLSSWCEGEQRSAQPPPGCTSTYWHQWPPRASRQLATARQGCSPPWGQPLTVTADELALVDSETAINACPGRIAIHADHAETAAALADACRLAGCDTYLMSDGPAPPGEKATAVVWDASVDEATDAQIVQRVRRAAGGGPVVAIVGFPRPEDQRRAIHAGVATVVSKPFLVRDLLWQVARVADVPG